MKNFENITRIHILPEREQSKITGGWWKKLVWFVINNWSDIKNGVKDGYDTYHER